MNAATADRGTAAIDPDLGADLASAALALARKFAAAATMWCVAPLWTEHARHIAVEFVHPVIVGKRALPAVYLDAPDPVGGVRTLSAPGDVLVLVGPADTIGAQALLRRAEVWGLMTLWIGAGRRPSSGAQHVLWADGTEPRAARHDGSVVRLYHLLWELTHVCFEHPGLVEQPDRDVATVCITCSDEGRPAEVLSVDDDGLASVRSAAGTETVDTALVAPVAIGDLVLVHAGTAIALITEESG
jgi:hydrogenase maturation factor